MQENKFQRQFDILLKNNNIPAEHDNTFYQTFKAHLGTIGALYEEIYHNHSEAEKAFLQLLQTILAAHASRHESLRQKDKRKEKEVPWFLSNQLIGMSLYVDRFCSNLKNLVGKIGYFKSLGINLIHLMPVFESPEGESDGGYAVSDFRKVDERFGTLDDLKNFETACRREGIYLMLDIVLNHTSQKNAWALQARKGDKHYQDFFYFFGDRTIPDEFEKSMPEIFPESSPGNFTYVPECGKWVMTVFHHYQWDLNYTNPHVFVAMLDNILFYGNLGVDILRIDAPAFIWKQLGTSCQNLPEAHALLRLIKQCTQVAAPGMALLGEAIVAPKEIMKYFGTGSFLSKECDFAYNATQMALQWDALATGDTRIMLSGQSDLLQKPYGTSWITYTRCHDDIGLGFDDHLITGAGFEAFAHRKFLKTYYAGNNGSPASGALFSVNEKTQDARISGSLASLCGLEKAIIAHDDFAIDVSVKKILLMQAMSFFIGGVPMLFYGDEIGYTNDYSYLSDPAKSYDNRWMHRPEIDWEKNKKRHIANTTEHRIFSSMQKLIGLRKKFEVFSDSKKPVWLSPRNKHVIGFLRDLGQHQFYCIFNFSDQNALLTWWVFREHKSSISMLTDHWGGSTLPVGQDHENMVCEPYGFYLLEEANLGP